MGQRQLDALAMNAIRKTITDIELYLMPDPGETVNVSHLETLASSVRSQLDSLIDRHAGTQ